MPDNKPMTPEEFAKRLAADKYISLTYEQRIAMKLSEWAESIRREAKREAAIYCYDAAKGPYVDWNKIIAYIQSLSSAPIDTPPAADRAPETVCPTCEGRLSVLFWGRKINCHDCHGTGKRALVDNKKGE